jgi:N-acetylglucosaminyldiphosphoundecaprenol N-acetyl-beta-D-mannosaminyltransferase
MKDKIEIAGVGFSPLTYDGLFEEVKKCLAGDKRARVIKANGEFLHRALNNKEFRDTMNSANVCIADGVGILWADKYLSLSVTNLPVLKHVQAAWQLLWTGAGLLLSPKKIKNKLPERLSGVEVFYAMMRAAIAEKKSVFYFGARPEVLEKAVKIIKEKFPELNIADYADGYGDKGEVIIERINKSGASLLIVALGSPEQDYWIRDNLNKLKNIRVAAGEGGSFDAIAGAAKRAPKIIQSMSLEWLWRMFTVKNLTNNAPHRFKRAWNAVPGFMFAVMKWKINND